MKHVARALVVLVAVTAVGAAIMAYTVIRRGLSTQVAPSAGEEVPPRAMRFLATPSEVCSRQNPVEATEAVLEEGLEHFADHCALCRANDGSGDTAIDGNLYPSAPDVRGPRRRTCRTGS